MSISQDLISPWPRNATGRVTTFQEVLCVFLRFFGFLSPPKNKPHDGLTMPLGVNEFVNVSMGFPALWLIPINPG